MAAGQRKEKERGGGVDKERGVARDTYVTEAPRRKDSGTGIFLWNADSTFVLGDRDKLVGRLGRLEWWNIWSQHRVQRSRWVRDQWNGFRLRLVRQSCVELSQG